MKDDTEGGSSNIEPIVLADEFSLSSLFRPQEIVQPLNILIASLPSVLL